MVEPRADRGRHAEDLVAALLERRGFVVLARNARAGRLELDLIARRGALLVVCEVRSRTGDRYGSPAETIDPRKIARVRRAAAQWLAAHPQGTRELRFDAAAVTFRGPDRPPDIDYYEDAF